MKSKKGVAVLLAGLVGVGSCFSVSPKAKAVDAEDVLEIAGGIVALGLLGGIVVIPIAVIGGVVVLSICCGPSNVSFVVPKDPQEEFNKLESFGLSMANRVNNPNSPYVGNSIMEFDRLLLSYLEAVPGMHGSRIGLGASQCETLNTGCAFYNEVGLMISHIEATISYVRSYNRDVAQTTNVIANLKALKRKMKTIRESNYKIYNTNRTILIGNNVLYIN